MSNRDGLGFAVTGALVWAAASLFYLAFARGLIEHAFWFYVLNVGLAAAGLMLFFGFTARFLRIPRSRRLFPALSFALPGMAAGAFVVSNFAALAPHLDAASQGRYGALLVVAYGALFLSALERPAKRRA